MSFTFAVAVEYSSLWSKVGFDCLCYLKEWVLMYQFLLEMFHHSSKLESLIVGIFGSSNYASLKGHSWLYAVLRADDLERKPCAWHTSNLLELVV